jgi:hypothetical protein
MPVTVAAIKLVQGQSQSAPKRSRDRAKAQSLEGRIDTCLNRRL